MITQEQAWCTREWVKGRTQIDIGNELGIANSAVCVAISKFCAEAGYGGNYFDYNNPDRHHIAKRALGRYIGPFIKPTSHIEDREYHNARMEHSWLLRAEGLTLRQIGERLGLSATAVQGHIVKFGRMTQRAIHKPLAKTRRRNYTPDTLNEYLEDHPDEVKLAEQIVADNLAVHETLEPPPPVVIESPYRGATNKHLAYLRRCIIDSLGRGEAPFASHQMYIGVLDDDNAKERCRGMQCGYVWLQLAAKQVFYTDMGWSTGMIEAWEMGGLLNKPWTVRALDSVPVQPPNDWERERHRVHDNPQCPTNQGGVRGDGQGPARR